MSAVAQVAPLVVAALLLALPLLPPLRGDVARLIRKGYARSQLQALLGRLTGAGASGPMRFSITDAGLVLLPFVVLVPVVAGSRLDLVSFGLGVVLLLLALFDLRYRQLPNELTLPLAAIGIAGAEFVGPGLVPSLIGMIAAGGGVWLVGTVFERVRGVAGLGGGDVKLIAAMGAWLGPLPVAQAIGVAALTAALAETTLQVMRHGRVVPGQRIAFGAYLAGAFWVSWCVAPLLEI
jgi:prepilin signal peptidase PulO-like enzyme (type II secretory pathway)